MNKYLLLEFPFYSLSTAFNKKKIQKMIKEFQPIIHTNKVIKLQKFKLEKYENSYFLIEDNWKKNENINSITDFFSEKIRITCQFNNKISPLEYWKQYKKDILMKTIHQYKELSIYNIRETIFFNTKLCSNFRISVCLAILQHFKPKKWLDISAGWGDRLLSAIFYKIKLYVATDPNKELHSAYQNIIDTFVPPSKRKNFIILPTGFEVANLPDEKFDIVFSSPPFFDLEKYSTFEDNSFKKYNTEKKWCSEFLIKSLIKSYNYLKKGGHILLYLSGSPYVMEQMHKLDKVMEYKGIIYFYDDKPRAIYVWKKIKNDILLKL
jgi:hypothetical protein